MAQASGDTFSAAWQDLADLKSLARIAAELHIRITIRGSLVDALFSFLQGSSSSRSPSSFLELLPPFSDVDLVVPSVKDAELVRALIRETIPDSDFVHWDIRTTEEVGEYAKRSTIVLDDQQVLHLERESEDLLAVTPTLRYCRRTDRYSLEGLSEFSVPRIGTATSTSVDPATTVADLFYLARRAPHLLHASELEHLATILQIHGARQVLQSLSGRRARTRLEFSILKLLLTENWPGVTTILSTILGIELLRALEHQKRYPLISRLVNLYLANEERPLQAIAIPHRTAKGWRGRLSAVSVYNADIPDLSRPAWRELQQWLGTAGETQLGADLPVFSVRCGPPQDPTCCRYRDFARGVLEIGWANPGFPGSGGLSVLVPVIADAEDGFTFAHAQGSTGRAGIVRLDYNFLATVSGRLGEVWIIAAKGVREL